MKVLKTSKWPVEVQEYVMRLVFANATNREVSEKVTAQFGIQMVPHQARSLIESMRNADGVKISDFTTTMRDPPIPEVPESFWHSRNAWMLGDPPVGRSALDRRMAG